MISVRHQGMNFRKLTAEKFSLSLENQNTALILVEKVKRAKQVLT
jgi:hypothetical protein